MATFFGLPGLPKGEAYLTRSQDLKRAECVRAFLGSPRLVILETPTRGVYPELLSPLLNAIKAVREKGAAVLWLTADPREWSDANIAADMKGMFFGSRLRVSREKER